MSRPTQVRPGASASSLQARRLLWGGFPARFGHLRPRLAASLQPRPRGRFGLLPFRSPLLGESRLIYSPPGTEMFQFPGLAPSRLCVRRGGTLSRGFPHSGPRGSKAVCASPRIFAACRALLRRRTPRHPPRALHRFVSMTPSSGAPASRRGARVGRPAPPKRAAGAPVCSRFLDLRSLSLEFVLRVPHRAGPRLARSLEFPVEPRGLEPRTPRLQTWCSTG